MNKSIREAQDFADLLSQNLGAGSLKLGEHYEVGIAPSATHLSSLSVGIARKSFRLGAQNCGTAQSGAYTGENSPSVLKELGCDWVIVGHSERRHIFKETDLMVLTRLNAGLEQGLDVMLCVGEVLQDRKAGKTFKVIETQLSVLLDPGASANFMKRLIVAYEPVWAIGTGENATPQQAQEVHEFIRGWFSEKVSKEEAQSLRILYGGSVKPENSAQLLAQKDVDGLLVGGASLDPQTFANVIKNGLKSRT